MAEDALTEAPEETTDEAQDDATPDISEQLADLGARFDKFAEAQQPAPQPATALDLLDLGFDEEDFDDEDDEEPAPQEEPAAAFDPARLEALEEWAIRQEMERRTAALNALPSKYSDFNEKVPQIKAVLAEMDLTPAQKGDAKLVERIYLSLKAEAAASTETSAEEAARRGARLETGASGNAPAEEDPDAEFKSALRSIIKEEDDVF